MLAVLPLFLSVCLGQAPQADLKAITLSRVGKADEHLSYSVKSHLQVEFRGTGLNTWIPQDLDISYGFNLHILKINPGGMMVTRFACPTITEIQGETFDTPAKTTIHKVDQSLELIVSPINEIIGVPKDLTPASTGKKPGDCGPQTLFFETAGSSARQLDSRLSNFVAEVYRIALNIGSIDSSLDFAPKLPLDDVKPGDTWKKTVGYSPQQVAGGKTAVQRMDYTYTYQGVVTDSTGKKVRRITADLDMTSDLNSFFNQMAGTSFDDTGVKSIVLNLKQHLDFDLDMVTGETLHAAGSATGGFAVVLTANPDQAVHEERFNGQTELKLLSRT